MADNGTPVRGRRWTKHGKDRLFVSLDDRPLGWVDLQRGALVPEANVPVHVLAAGVMKAAPSMGITLPAFTHKGVPWPDATPTVKAHDLAGNVAGKGVAKQARAERGGLSKDALKWMGADALAEAGINRDDRVWDAGAKGERIVGKALEQFAAAFPAGTWQVLHSVPIGSNGADIDHVVVGPPGVITINAKFHPRRSLVATAAVLYVDGEASDYLDKSAIEAERAGRALHRVLSWPVPVTPMIVLAAGSLEVRERPRGVAVLSVDDLPSWLGAAPLLLNPGQIQRVYGAARNRNTWVPQK